jgi:Holliday junction resolvase-like predicted endonuclease
MFSGKFLEKLFIEKLAKQGYYNKIGTYWEKSNQNEIDIVAVNDLEKYILFAEVKRQQSNINLELLKKKSLKLTHKFNGYKFFYKGFSLQDI